MTSHLCVCDDRVDAAREVHMDWIDAISSLPEHILLKVRRCELSF
jgi:hypothetical protein